MGYAGSTAYSTLAAWQSALSLDAHSISADPLFNNAAAGDFHVKSSGGRYDPTTNQPPSNAAGWVTDIQSSPVIDKGQNPATYPGTPLLELSPNGGQVNMGAYSNTEQASKTNLTNPTLKASPNGLVVIQDTGVSSTDRITNWTSPTLTIGFTEVVTINPGDITVTDPNGANVPFTVTNSPSDNILLTLNSLPLTVNGTYTVTAYGTIKDVWGLPFNGGNLANQTFVLDTVAPAIPTVSLLTDTGTSSTDRLTSNSALSLGGIETGAVLEYEVNGSTTWTTTYAPTDGTVSVQVRQRDVAGNPGLAAAAFTFTLDTTAPAAPTVSLTTDTGASSTDGLTSNPALSIGGLETGAVIQYAVNGVTTWLTSYAPADGTVSVLVRQLDVAGNPSVPAPAVTFTLDTTAAAPIVSLLTDTGASSTDKITSNPALSLPNIETGAIVEYEVNDAPRRGRRPTRRSRAPTPSSCVSGTCWATKAQPPPRSPSPWTPPPRRSPRA